MAEAIPIIAWWFIDKKKALETEQKYRETNKRIAEALAAQEQERAARQEVERKEEQERLGRQEAESREKQERLARENAERKEEQERLARQETERRAEEDRLAREQAEYNVEQERLARREAENRVQEERQAREDAEQREEKERLARQEVEHRLEQECLAREQAERRVEQERLARQEAERKEEEARRARDVAEHNEKMGREANEKERYERELRDLGVPADSETMIDAAIKDAREMAGYEESCVNIAVIGSPGAGKSSLVNSLRGLSRDDRGAAKVGEGTTTHPPPWMRAKYKDDYHKNVVWYDIPASETRNVSAFDYYLYNDLYIFDKIVFVHNTKLTKSDLRVLKLCQYRKQDWISVRSKADFQIWNCKRRKGIPLAEARQCYIDAVQADMAAYDDAQGENMVPELKLSVKDYIVSEVGVLQLVTGSEPSDDPFEQLIDEAAFLEKLGLSPRRVEDE
ncbi:interferon-inducible GTPase-domain-containing protein [Daldinia bambusicola]|nr:interferon-inducible GTPase-domain-containing protein [Daldinia bambusicola]